MTEQRDIVERLRARTFPTYDGKDANGHALFVKKPMPLGEEAAAEIARLRAEIKRVRGLLKEAADELKAVIAEDTCDHSVGICFCSTFDILDRAYAALPAGQRVAEPAHPGTAGDSGSDQGKQGGTASDPDSQGRHGPHSFSTSQQREP